MPSIKLGVPGGAVRDVQEALNAPEAAGRRMVREVPHPLAGSVKLMASPINMSATPVRDPAAPPTLGQHTDEVLRELLGYGDAELTRLKDSGVTSTTPTIGEV